MSEEQNETASAEEQAAESVETQSSSNEIQLSGLYAFKVGMSTIYNDQGSAVPVTVLRYEPWVVSQIKSPEKDGYSSIQIACKPKKKKNAKKPEINHLAKAGFENGAQLVREIRQEVPEDCKVGQRVSIASLAKGDTVHLCARSKGRGFSGVMRRYDFGGGRASHGSGFHRKPGSIGNCEFPGRVMPGKKMPGQYGDKNITVKNLEVVDVLSDENVVLVKGSVPGARNSLVRIMKK